MNDTLTISPSVNEFTVDIPPAILESKKVCVELMQDLTKCESEADLGNIIAAASLSKGLEKQCEDARTKLKAPILEAGRRIDTVAKGFASGLALERIRIEKLAAQYQAKLNAAAEALKREELAAMAQETDMSEDAMRFRASRSAELAQVEKPSGASFRTFTDYTIDDPLAAVAARSDLFTIEVKRREMLAYLSIPNHKPIPGVFEFTNNTLHAKAS